MLKNSDQTLHRTLLPTSGQFTGGEQMQHRSDRMLNNVPSSVRCEDGPASGQTTKKMSGSTGLCCASDHEAPNTSGHDLRGFGPLCCRPNFGWQRPVVATGASGQLNPCGSITPFLSLSVTGGHYLLFLIMHSRRLVLASPTSPCPHRAYASLVTPPRLT